MNEEMRSLRLTEAQEKFLRDKYSDTPEVAAIMANTKDGVFTVDVDTYCDFYDWLEDESVETMIGEECDPSEETLVIEGIIDSLYRQNN